MIKELKELIENDKDLSPFIFDGYHGIKFNKLRKIAKMIAREKRYDFFKENHDCFEEKIIHAYAIGYVKEDISFQLKLVNDFIPTIDNWAINDSLCQNMLFAKTNQKEVFDFLEQMKDSQNEWEIRVIAVTLLSHFLNDKYIDKVIETIDCLNKVSYMSKMGIAWAIATMMAKYPQKTFAYLKENTLDDFTYNKAISKMIESYRVKDEHKKILKTMKRAKHKQ